MTAGHPRAVAALLALASLNGCTVIAVADTVGSVAVKTVGVVVGAGIDLVAGDDEEEDADK